MRKHISIFILGLMFCFTAAWAYAPLANAENRDAPAPPAAPADASPSPAGDSDTSTQPAVTMPKIPRPESLPGSVVEEKSGKGVWDYFSKDMIPVFIQGFLIFMGVSALLFTIIGGLQFVIAMGNEEESTQARKAIMYAIGGLIISMIAFSLVSIINRLGKFLEEPDASVSAPSAQPSAPAPAAGGGGESFFIEQAFAAPTKEQLDKLLPTQEELFGKDSGTEKAPRLIGQKGQLLLHDLAPGIIKIILGLGGSIVFVIFVITGIRLIVGSEDEEELNSVKRTFTYASIGFAVIAASYGIIFGILKIFSNL